MYNSFMKIKILIVDDTLGWIEFHKSLIGELYGELFEITTASCAKEAVEIIQKNKDNPFSIIISDLQMETDYEPKLAGEWLCEQVKNIHAYSNSKIILISAMYNIEHIAKSLNVECIPKNRLVNNKLLMKFMLEKLMPFLSNIGI